MDLAVLSDNHQQRSQDNVFNGAKATITAVRLNSKYQRSIPRTSTRDLVCNIGRNHSRLVFDRRPEIVRITQLAVLTNGNQYIRGTPGVLSDGSNCEYYYVVSPPDHNLKKSCSSLYFDTAQDLKFTTSLGLQVLLSSCARTSVNSTSSESRT